jgi:hypothetical protein
MYQLGKDNLHNSKCLLGNSIPKDNRLVQSYEQYYNNNQLDMLSSLIMLKMDCKLELCNLIELKLQLMYSNQVMR